MIKTKIFYDLPNGRLFDEGLDGKQLDEIGTISMSMKDGKNIVKSKYPEVQLKVSIPQEGYTLGMYEVRFRGENMDGIGDAVSEFIKASGLPDYTKGWDGLVNKVLSEHDKRLKWVSLFLREVVDA